MYVYRGKIFELVTGAAPPPPPSLVFVTTPSCDVQSVSPLFTNTDDQRLTVEVH